MIRSCVTCEKEFYVRPSKVKKGHGTYCSRSCRPAWNKGVKLSPEQREVAVNRLREWWADPLNRKKLSLSIKGRLPWNTGKKRPHMTGELNWRWRGGITPETKAQRVEFWTFFRKRVFERDNYTCQKCSIRGANLHADHIKPWAEYPEERFSLDNCRTLCRKCHYEVTFGKVMKENSNLWAIRLGSRALR